jgi:hypothetical protein
MRKTRKRLFHEIFVRSWWVWLFALLCYAVYDYAIRRQDRRQHRLEQQIERQEERLTTLQLQYEDLERRLQSQSDPAWLEMVLMEQLGVVPKGQTKVFFEESS